MTKYTLGQELYRAVVRGQNIYYEHFVVQKVTAAGAWVIPRTDDFCLVSTEGRRWVSGRGKWCSATKEQALKRLKSRTASYVRHCRRRLKDAESRAKILGLSVSDPPKFNLYEY